jgi:hypothetical protein
MKYSDAAQALLKDFWNFDTNKYISDYVLSRYSANLDRLIINANSIINTASIESATFWSELIRSNFIIKFVNATDNIFNHKKTIENTEEAIKIIKNVYENSYQYFAFYTISDLNSTTELYKYWFKPNKAKELDKDENNNPWKINSSSVSGKFWVINNFPLFMCATFDIKLLREIRDCDSHESLIVRDGKMHLLHKEKTVEITIEEVFKIATYLKECIAVVSHFYLVLLLKEKLWMFLLIFIQNDNRYKNAIIPFHIIKNIRNNDKPKLDLDNVINKDIAALTEICLSYALDELWVDLKKERNRLDVRLSKLNLQTDLSNIDRLKKEALFDFYSIINIFLFKSKQLFLELKEEYKELELDEMDKLDFDAMIEDAKKTYLKIIELKERDRGVWILINIVLVSFIGIIAPLKKLMDNFNKIVITK